MKSKDLLTEERAGWIVQGVASLVPVYVIGTSAVGYANNLIHPTLTRTMRGGGIVEARVEALTDPGVFDRFMAALPVLPCLLGVILAFWYIVQASVFKLEKPEVKGGWNMGIVLIAAGGFLVCLLSLSAERLKAVYFDTGTPRWEYGYSPLIFGIIFLILSDLSTKIGLAGQKNRADDLDRKMQDVV